MEILKLNQKSYKKVLEKAIKAIKGGRVLICPTDTVYGLICDGTNKEAVKKIFKIKKRPRKKPISIFVQDIKTAKRFAYINKDQERFLQKMWPGKITAVLKSKQEKRTTGVRIPNYKLVLDLIKQTNLPLAESSANISGKPASTEIKEVLKQFKNQQYQPDLIIDAGNLKKSRPSTVIDLRVLPFKILRT